MSARTRNFSNWAYWRLQLERGRVARRAPPPTTTRGGRAPAPSSRRGSVRIPRRCRSTSRSPRRSTAATTRARGSCSTSKRRCRCPRISSSRTRAANAAPGPAVLAIHGHGPGKSLVCGIEPGGPGRRLRARARVARLRRARARPARLRRTRRLDAARQVPLRLGSRLRDDGRRRSARAQPLGSRNARSTCCATHPLVDPARVAAAGLSYGGTCTLFLAALDERVRVAVVSGYLSSWRAAHTVPWNMCGSQVMPGQLGAIEHVDIAALDRAPAAARRVGNRRHDLPGRVGAGDGRAAARALRPARRARRMRSCTTCSKANIAGTAPRCRHSWRGGCEHDRRPSAGARSGAAGAVPAARSARRDRRARRPGPHVGSAPARPRRASSCIPACSAPGSASRRAPRPRAGVR